MKKRLYRGTHTKQHCDREQVGASINHWHKKSLTYLSMAHALKVQYKEYSMRFGRLVFTYTGFSICGRGLGNRSPDYFIVCFISLPLFQFGLFALSLSSSSFNTSRILRPDSSDCIHHCFSILISLQVFTVHFIKVVFWPSQPSPTMFLNSTISIRPPQSFLHFLYVTQCSQ